MPSESDKIDYREEFEVLEDEIKEEQHKPNPGRTDFYDDSDDEERK